MKRIALLLLLAAAPAWAQTLVCRAGSIVTLICADPGTTPTPAPVPTPTPAPIPTPPPAAPAAPPAGWIVSIDPFTYEPVMGPGVVRPFEINTWFTYRFQAGPNRVNVHPINFNPAFYSGNGAILSTAITPTNGSARDYVVSTTAGSMTPISPYCQRKNQGLASLIDISFNGTAGKCAITKGQQYYLNVKASGSDTTVDYLLNATVMP